MDAKKDNPQREIKKELRNQYEYIPHCETANWYSPTTTAWSTLSRSQMGHEKLPCDLCGTVHLYYEHKKAF